MAAPWSSKAQDPAVLPQLSHLECHVMVQDRSLSFGVCIFVCISASRKDEEKEGALSFWVEPS